MANGKPQSVPAPITAPPTSEERAGRLADVRTRMKATDLDFYVSVDPVNVYSLRLLYLELARCPDRAYALLASRLRYWFAGPLMRGPLPRYASGAVYIDLGVSTAFADRR